MVDSIQLGPWPVGINNRQPDYALPDGALRNAVNVDILLSGHVRRRSGYERVYSGVDIHSGFGCPAGLFFIEGFNLKQLLPDNTAKVLRGGILGRTCFLYFDGIVYFSDGVSTGRIIAGVATHWGVDAHLAGDSDYMAMPPCSILAHYNGRIYGAVGDTLWFTDPFTYGSVHKQRGFLQFAANISIVEPVTDGLWVVADKTYFYRGGGPGSFTVDTLLDYGAVPYTSSRVPNSNSVVWYSQRGLVMATENGKIENLQEPNVAVESATFGATVVRGENGVLQSITSISDVTMSPLAARDWIEMEVIRRTP